MSSDKNDFFTGLFDLNGDGKISPDEEFLSYKMFEEAFADTEKKEAVTDIFYSPALTKTEKNEPVKQKDSAPVVTKENYKELKASAVKNILLHAAGGLAATCLSLIILKAVFSVSGDGSAAVSLLFSGVALFISGSAWLAVLPIIKENYKSLQELNESYKKLLTQDELGNRRNKKRKAISAVISVLIIFLAIAVTVSSVNKAHLSRKYEEAVSLYENGSYDEAKVRFEEIRDENFKDTEPFIALCKAHIDYNKGFISTAYFDIKDIHFHYLGAEQADEYNRFLSLLKEKYKSYLKKVSEANTKTYREKIRNGVPFVGMPESEIKNTSLGAPSETVRHNIAWVNGKRYTANIYDFKEGNATIFTARCVRNLVTEVWDHRSSPVSPYVPDKNKTSGTENDPYNVNDYSNEEDFYDDHYDDFFDYYDAEDYYREHHK